MLPYSEVTLYFITLTQCPEYVLGELQDFNYTLYLNSEKYYQHWLF